MVDSGYLRLRKGSLGGIRRAGGRAHSPRANAAEQHEAARVPIGPPATTGPWPCCACGSPPSRWSHAAYPPEPPLQRPRRAIPPPVVRGCLSSAFGGGDGSAVETLSVFRLRRGARSASETCLPRRVLRRCVSGRHKKYRPRAGAPHILPRAAEPCPAAISCSFCHFSLSTRSPPRIRAISSWSAFISAICARASIGAVLALAGPDPTSP